MRRVHRGRGGERRDDAKYRAGSGEEVVRPNTKQRRQGREVEANDERCARPDEIGAVEEDPKQNRGHYTGPLGKRDLQKAPPETAAVLLRQRICLG